jgi:hypothetical protein
VGEYGILMKDEMVRALLRPVGHPLRKRVTRRTSGQWARRKVGDLLWVRECWAPTHAENPRIRVSYRSDGTSYGLNNGWANGPDGGLLFPEPLGIRIPFPTKWRPSMAMPRWASRLTLRVVGLWREHAAPSSITHRWIGEGQPDPQPTAVYLYGPETNAHRGHVPGYAAVPHWGEPLPWVDDAEARREGVEDRAAYLRLWESINGDQYPTWVWRIEFEEASRG